MSLFSGNAIAVYGTVSPDYAHMQIPLDGEDKIVSGGSGGFTSKLHRCVIKLNVIYIYLHPTVQTLLASCNWNCMCNINASQLAPVLCGRFRAATAPIGLLRISVVSP